MKILILCTGNSCRSQMAEGWLRSWDNTLTVASAGTKPAGQIHPLAVAVMAEAGIDISGSYPKDVRHFLGESWDFVITVCDGAAETCPVFEGQVEHKIHIGVEDPAELQGTAQFVQEGFRKVRDELRRKFAEFYIREVQGQTLPHCSCSE